MRNTIDTSLQKHDVWLLAALILISLAVRIPGVSSRAIWYDEAITLLETAGNPAPTWSESPTPAATQKELLTGNPTLGEIAIGLRDTDVHPPFYYLLLSKWRLVTGQSIEAARILSVAISTATVVLFYLLLRSAGFAHPIVPGLVYALSSGAVHYGHEARNYSLAMLLIIAAAFCAFLATKKRNINTKFFWFLSAFCAVFCGLTINTNYLSIFSVFFLMLWYVFWLPKRRRLYSVPILIGVLIISMTVLWVLPSQLGARPKQFREALGIGDEIRKIFDFNLSMLWNPVHVSSGVQFATWLAISVLAILSIRYVIMHWNELDKRISSLMTGLAVAPSAGLLALDLIFDKDLGKSSYVLFAGPAIVFFLTLACGFRKVEGDGSKEGTSLTTGITVFVVPFFIALQLTGINFDLERTPGFAGSTIRTMAATIEASSPPPLVVVGAGHGRGDPATLIYELSPETTVCVVSPDSDLMKMRREIAAYENVWLVFAKGRKTDAVEEQLYRGLTRDDGYRVVSRANRLARLKKQG